MTPEQEFLKVCAENILDNCGLYPNKVIDASQKYLATLEQGNQFRDVKEKVDLFTDVSKKVEPEPAWKPEVGKLYKESSGLIGECISVAFDNDKIYIRYLGDKDGFCLSKADFTPITELEGLKVSDEK